MKVCHPSAGRRLLAGLLLASLVACGRGSDGAGRPNVVLIVVDTLRADAVLGGVVQNGDGPGATPNMAALARDGVAFPQAFSHAPLTLPSHTSLFSSRPPFETGVLNNRQKVPGHLPMLADWLGDFGYETAAVLSLGTLYALPGSAIDRGFDVYDADFWNLAQAPDVVARFQRRLDDLEDDQPFFLFTHFCDPHEPYNAHGTSAREAEVLLDGEPLDVLGTADMTMWERDLELAPGRHVFEVRSDSRFRLRGFSCTDRGDALAAEWVEGEQASAATRVQVAVTVEGSRARSHSVRLWVNDVLSIPQCRERYLTEVEFVDRHVGIVLDELKRRGLYDESLIVFTSDHGEALGERGMVGHAETVYDELLRVPLIVKLPAGDERVPALRVAAERLVTLLDVTPTLLDLLGLPPLPDQRGASVLSSREPLLIAETHKPEAKRNLICLRDESFKMIYDSDAATFEMYDLGADPGESRDVFEERSGERREWISRLETIGRLAQQGGLEAEDIDAETAERLRALGY